MFHERRNLSTLRTIATVVVLAIGVAILPPAVTQPANAAESGAFTVQETGGSFVGHGYTGSWSSAVYTSASGPMSFTDGRFAFSGHHAEVRPPTGQKFVSGQTYIAQRYADNTNAGLIIYDGTPGCNPVVGSLKVFEAGYSGATLTSFAADYEYRCGSASSPATYGSMRWNTSVGFAGLPAPGSVAIPLAYVGETVPGESILLENLGTIPLQFGTAQLTNPQEFKITSNTCAGLVLPVGESCRLQIAKAALSPGHAYGQLTIDVPTLPSGRLQIQLEGSAEYAPPANDSLANATSFSVADLPYSNTQTSFSATQLDPADPEPVCQSGTANSVWYRLDTGADPISVYADVERVDFPAADAPHVSVYRQSGNTLTPVGCGGQELDLAANSSYAFMVGGYVVPDLWEFWVEEVPDPDFIGVNPTRFLDTRSSVAVQAGTVRALTVTGVKGIPADASAVSMNVTVTGGTQAGFITVFPCGSSRPLSSNLNYTPGQTIPNAVLSKVGANRQVCFYASGTTHLVVDLNGYFPAESKFAPIAPKRAADTRNGTGVRAGVVKAGTSLAVPVAGKYGVPADASAVSLNVTVTQPAGGGFVTAYPCGTSRPTASNLNFVAGQTIPNAVISAVGGNGSVCFWASANTQLVVDVNGAFAADANYWSFAPERVLDSRTDRVSPVQAGEVLRVQLAEPGELAAASMNVTVTQTGAPGYLTVYPCDAPRPTASNLNFVAGQTIPNAVLSPVSASGYVCFYTSARTELIVDVNGVFPG